MSHEHDVSYLKDILQAAKQIQTQHMYEVDQSAFNGNITIQRAVLFEITVIGEAVKQLSKAFRGRYPEIPWKDIAGMRDRIIHGYRRIDLQEVWNTATSDIPSLIAQLEPLVSAAQEEDET